jgi:uncharacterized protein Yka (UPF0111/DUF47 family)
LAVKSKTKSPEDTLLQNVGELVQATQHLAKRAVREYSPVVESLLLEQNHDVKNIEHCLDGLLDFCFDADILLLYKKLCRHYFEIDQNAAIFYVNAYREMWDQDS